MYSDAFGRAIPRESLPQRSCAFRIWRSAAELEEQVLFVVVSPDLWHRMLVEKVESSEPEWGLGEVMAARWRKPPASATC